MSRVRVGSSFAFAALVLLALAPAVASAAAVTAPINGVAFSTPQDGYLVGGANFDGFVSWTHDGGATWHAFAPNDGHQLLGVAASLDSASAMAVGSTFDGVRKTANGGMTWTDETPLNVGSVYQVRDAAYLAGDRRVVVGTRQPNTKIAFIASSVGGAPWAVDYEGPFYSPIDESTDPTSTLSDMAAIDATSAGRVAWAVGNNQSYLGTNNNNATSWESLIFKTVDGGSSWTTQTAPGLHAVTSVAAVDTQTAFIGSSAGRRGVLKTTDGSNWSEVAGLTSVTVNAIDAIDANHVVAVGDNGQVASTNNALAATPNWRVRAEATGTALLGVQMLSQSSWIVVGDKETILRTEDGGQTWTGSRALAAPTVHISAPTRDTMLAAPTISIEGTATDGAGVGVAKVEVRIQRGDGQNWTGSAWSDGEQWLSVDTSATSDSWSGAFTPSDLPSPGASMTISAKATDGFGQVGTTSLSSLPPSLIAVDHASMTIDYNASAKLTGHLTSDGKPVSNGSVKLSDGSGSAIATLKTDGTGAFTYSVKPTVATTYSLSYAGDSAHNATAATVKVIPHAYVSKPVLSTSHVSHSHSFNTRADVHPKHTKGTHSVLTFTFQRSSGGHWATYKTVSATAVSVGKWTRGTVSAKLPAGKWRVQAVHADAGHASTSSARTYFTVH